MKVEVVSHPQNLLSTLMDFQPDLILMDLHMPECTGIELANVIRQQESYVSVPIVFLSSEQDVHQQLDALTLGADDFLTKPVEPYYLITAVRSRAHRARILRTLMVRDGLTGLLNHTYFFELLEVQVSRAARSIQPLSFAMLDLDHFKLVNDRYGHPVGDRVLKSLANLLQQRLRKSDTIGRYGGEEFAIIFPDTDAETAKNILEEILRAFRSVKQFAGEEEFIVTFSGGIATLVGNDNPSAITRRADQALYQAKNLGRNQIAIA
jgi:diguanylate cyclase (GGDEF)-like protein